MVYLSRLCSLSTLSRKQPGFPFGSEVCESLETPLTDSKWSPRCCVQHLSELNLSIARITSWLLQAQGNCSQRCLLSFGDSQRLPLLVDQAFGHQRHRYVGWIPLMLAHQH